MRSMQLPILIVTLILLKTVLSLNWTGGRSRRVLKSLKFGTNAFTTSMNLRGIQHDSDTGDYFYVGQTYSYGHFVSRMDYTGNLKWGRTHNASGYNYSGNNTFEYSPTHQALYYTLTGRPMYLLKADSVSGNILNSFEISNVDRYSSQDKCSLSKDELALFWIIYKGSDERIIIRLDTNTSRIDTRTI